jgi:hypothetical protein
MRCFRWRSVAPATVSVGFCISGEVVGGDGDGRVGCLMLFFIFIFLLGRGVTVL